MRKNKRFKKTIADLSSAFYSLAIAKIGISFINGIFIERDEFTEIVREKIEKINMENKNGNK